MSHDASVMVNTDINIVSSIDGNQITKSNTSTTRNSIHITEQPLTDLFELIK